MKRCRSCLTQNENRYRNCQACGKPLPKKRKPKHMAVLNESYEAFVVLNGGDHCGVCGRPPSAARRLDRDHDHRRAVPRGLCCSRHNRMIDNRATAVEFRALADYLDRHEARLAA